MIFKITSSFPKTERFELVDQMRRSSRAVCSNLAEAYGKRNYQRHFASKITDAEMENYEVGAWDDISRQCGYISKEDYTKLININEEVGKLLNHIFMNPGKYKSKSRS